MKQLLQLIIILTLSFTSAFGQTITSREFFNEITDRFETGTMKFNMEGAAMSLILPNDSTYTSYIGKRASNQDVDPEKNWHMAAATNLFTGYVVMKLIEDGDLALTDKISKYMDTDNMSNVSGDITVEELLTSTSGLNEVYSNGGTDLYRDIWDLREKVWSPRDVLAYMPAPMSQKGFNYCHSNGYLLGFLIEDVTGNSLADEFESKIFNPLGFSDATISSGEAFNMKKLNGVYLGTDERSNFNHDSYMSSRGGSGALTAKTYDVATFLRMLLTEEILDVDLVKAMLTKTEGSMIERGSLMCASKITEYRGYQIAIMEVISKNGDTSNWVGHAGSGINNVLAFHWLEKDLTIVVSNNDVSSAMTQGALFFELACYAQSHIDNISDPVSINNKELEANISIYPNPTKQNLTIKTDKSIESISIMNAFGQIVYAENYNSRSAELNITLPNNLSSGNYFICLKSKNGITTKRIAVLR